MGLTPHYHGPASAFPRMKEWKSFETIFNANKAEMLQTGNTSSDIGRIWNGVVLCSKAIGVPDRVIFAIIMQESTGNVGVGTTTNMNGNGTGGLMQCYGSPQFGGKHGLSQDQITSMIMAGTKHFKENLKQVGDKDNEECIYEALRLYNSGSMNKADLSDGKGATNSYVSDVANRLCGKTN